MHAFNSQLSILNSQFLQLRRVATDLAALEQALAPYGLVPLHDDPTPPAQRDACASGYTVTRTGAGYIVTDAAGRVVAESIDLAMLRERAECAGDPVWTGNGGRETV
jgi:hypothetical protein